MTDKTHKLFPTRLAVTLTYLFHPFALPIQLTLLLRWNYLQEGIAFWLLFWPVFVTGCAVSFYRAWTKKSPFKKMALKDPATHQRILLPLALAAGALVMEIFSSILSTLRSFNLNTVLIIFVVALAVRYFYNISLELVSIGLLGATTFVYYTGDTYHIGAMAFLTIGFLMIRVQHYLGQHKIMESVIGLVLGGLIGYLTASASDSLFWSLYG